MPARNSAVIEVDRTVNAADLADGQVSVGIQLAGQRVTLTTNEFGGNSTAEFGQLLALFYQANDGQPSFRYSDFRNVLSSNPCPA